MSLRLDIAHNKLLRDIDLLESRVVSAAKIKNINVQFDISRSPGDRICDIYNNLEKMEREFKDEFSFDDDN